MNEKFNLSGKTALVTGGGSGIGEAIAKTLAANGAKIVILDNSRERGEKVSLDITNNGGESIALECDVSSEAGVSLAFTELATHYSPDILVNNAGIAHIGNIENTRLEDFDRVMNVNVKGIFLVTKKAIPLLKKNGGTIVNISSVAAHVGLADRFAYSASKGAVHAMTLSISKDYLADYIRCNSISPGRIHTPFVDGFLSEHYPGKEKEMFDSLSKTQPIGRMGTPEEVANLALYLCSDEAAFITGSNFSMDGGFVTLNS